MGEVKMEMPKYRSHKVVHALKIAAAEVLKNGAVTIAPADEGFAVFTTDELYSDRFKGDENDPGYYVVYEDGYKSWSPSAAFESGYTRVQLPAEAPIGYTKEVLTEILEDCLGESLEVSSLGLPKATEELAILMFLRPTLFSKHGIKIIKEALTDLRTVGTFQWQE